MFSWYTEEDISKDSPWPEHFSEEQTEAMEDIGINPNDTWQRCVAKICKHLKEENDNE